MAEGLLHYLIQVRFRRAVYRPRASSPNWRIGPEQAPFFAQGGCSPGGARSGQLLSWSSTFAETSPLTSDVARSPSLPECRHETRSAPTTVSLRPHFSDGPLNTPEQEAQDITTKGHNHRHGTMQVPQ
jgi:hypothetical protein